MREVKRSPDRSAAVPAPPWAGGARRFGPVVQALVDVAAPRGPATRSHSLGAVAIGRGLGEAEERLGVQASGERHGVEIESAARPVKASEPVFQLYKAPSEEQIEKVDARYNASALYMVTVDDRGRLPSLYFEDRPRTSRARQMHGTGPGMSPWLSWSEYFFPNKELVKTASAKAKEFELDPEKKQEWEEWAAKEGKLSEGIDKGHLEIIWNKKPERGNPHRSGGLATAVGGEYSNEDCRYIVAACTLNFRDPDSAAVKDDLNPKNPAKWRV